MLSTAVFCLFGVNKMRLFLAGPDQRLTPGLTDQFSYRFGLIGVEYVQRLFQLDHLFTAFVQRFACAFFMNMV